MVVVVAVVVVVVDTVMVVVVGLYLVLVLVLVVGVVVVVRVVVLVGEGRGGVGSLTQYMPRGNKKSGWRIARIVFDAGVRSFVASPPEHKRQSRNNANASATAPVGVFFGL